MNRFTTTGRLTADPEILRTQNGEAVARFRFAVSRTYKRDNEPEADFFSCVCFGKTAERFEKLTIQKGVKLLLEGELRNNDYTDRDGVKKTGFQYVINNFEFCESKGSGQKPQETAKKPPNKDFEPLPDEVSDEGLPFN